MIVKLFLLGRPGCGKSSAARRIEAFIKEIENKGFSTYRFKDFDILDEMSRNTQYSQCFTRTLDKGYERLDVLKGFVLDVALEELDRRLRHHIEHESSNQLILIEFARANYGEALEKFSKEVLQDAYFLFINLGLEDCITRIENRMLKPESTDDHYISQEMLRQYYTEQYFPIPDKDLVEGNFKIVNKQGSSVEGSFKVVNNHGPFKDFEMNVDDFVKKMI